MNTKNINSIIEISSPILILSYFFTHNILLVLMGITFSLYLINIKLIEGLIKYVNKILAKKKHFSDLYINNEDIKNDAIQMNLTKDSSNLTLVETIEELGFIPSIDKNDKNNAA